MQQRTKYKRLLFIVLVQIVQYSFSLKIIVEEKEIRNDFQKRSEELRTGDITKQLNDSSLLISYQSINQDSTKISNEVFDENKTYVIASNV